MYFLVTEPKSVTPPKEGMQFDSIYSRYTPLQFFAYYFGKMYFNTSVPYILRNQIFYD
jgi:hypothetical protein